MEWGAGKMKDLTEEVECCPYFFMKDCGVKISKQTYEALCLNDYQSCEIYELNQREVVANNP